MAKSRRCADAVARFRSEIAALVKVADLAESAPDDRSCRDHLFNLATLASSLSDNVGRRVEAMDECEGVS